MKTFVEWLEEHDKELLEARAGWLPTLGLTAASMLGGWGGTAAAQAQDAPQPTMGMQIKQIAPNVKQIGPNQYKVMATIKYSALRDKLTPGASNTALKNAGIQSLFKALGVKTGSVSQVGLGKINQVGSNLQAEVTITYGGN